VDAESQLMLAIGIVATVRTLVTAGVPEPELPLRYDIIKVNVGTKLVTAAPAMWK